MADQYYFADETGLVSFFTFTAEGVFTLSKSSTMMMTGPVKTVQFFHDNKLSSLKMVAFGDGGPGGKHSFACMQGGLANCGEIYGSANPLNTAAVTRAVKTSEKVRIWSGGDSGELFVHDGTPINGAGTVVERFQGEVIFGIALNKDTNRVFVVTSGKRICGYDALTNEKLCEVQGAHSKSIY